MKILAISDTHGQHKNFAKEYFEGIDMIIHAGDESNFRELAFNEREWFDFLEWYSELNVKYKVLIAGNHSAYLSKFGRRIKEDLYRDNNIVYLEHESTKIEGINIFGSPYTPTFGQWHFMKDRSKLDDYWKQVPDDTDILVTHGPPKTILDLSLSRDRELEFCGDAALLRHITERIKPAYSIFGHIHNVENIVNAGTKTMAGLDTTFMNVSCVTDGKFNMGLSSHGQKFEYNKQ